MTIGETGKIAYGDQQHRSIDPDKTVYETIAGNSEWVRLGGRDINARAWVSRFNFSGADQEKLCGVLSGGERNRLHLALTLKDEGNVLLLDEPTNDVDVNTIRALEDGLENTMRNAYHNKYYYNQNPTVDNVVGSFFTGLFNRIEFFAGLTPGYIFGPNDDSPRHGTYGGVKGESYMYIKNRFSLTADAGFGLSFNIWRFKLSVLPSVHYFITDNYRDVNNKSYTKPTGTESDFTDQARSWQFSIQGGLSFSF